MDHPRGTVRRFWAAAPAVLAAGAGIGAAAALPSASAATSSVALHAYAAPAGEYSSPVSNYLEPMAPDPDGSGEFFVVNDTGAHSSQLFKEPVAGGTPSFVRSLSDEAFTVSFVALVSHGGYDWGLSEDAIYGGIGPTGEGTINPNYAEPTAVRDITAGSDGDLYWTDNAGLINQDIVADAAAGALLAGTQYSTPSGVNPDAIAAAGGKLWFTDNAGHLYSLAPAGAGTFGGPYSATVSQYAHTLAPDAAGNLWAVGDGGSDILEISSSTGSTAHTYTAGLPTNPGITSLTVGPDGNIWFTESTAREVGELDPAGGAITNYPLPAGFVLPAPGSDVIAAGPAGSGTVFFGAETTDTTPAPAIGEVTLGATTTSTTSTTQSSTTSTSSHPTPPGRSSVSGGTAPVSSKNVTTLPLSCHGASGAICAGTVTLSYSVKSTVKGTRRKRSKVVTTTLASAKYRLTAGKSEKLAIRLDRAAVRLLAKARGHRLKVTETVKPVAGKATSRPLTLVRRK